MDEMVKQTAAYCRKKKLLHEKDTVLIALSGGADSVCLTKVLRALQTTWSLSLCAVHVHHGLRKNADKDEAFVKNFCEKEEIPLMVMHKDAAKAAKENALSVEEAGRILRRRAFHEAVGAFRADKIALAHHTNDQAETILWNLFRGSGVLGICGMEAKAGIFIRPLLFAFRGDIEAYLQRENQAYCIDESNFSTVYTRNKMRHRLLPMIQKEFNAKAVLHIARTGEAARRMQTYCEKEAEKSKKRCVKKEAGGACFMDRESFLGEEGLLQDLVIKAVLQEVANEKKDIGHAHIEAVKQLFQKPVEKEVHLPYGMRAVSTYKGVRIEQNDAVRGSLKEAENKNQPREKADDIPVYFLTDAVEKEYKDGIQGTVKAYIQNNLPKEIFRQFSAKVFTLHEKDDREALIKEKRYTLVFDYDIIKTGLTLRTRRPSDEITIYKDGGKKKLKDYFINEKVPRDERDFIPLLAEGSEILWVVGHRMSEKYKVTEKTKRVLMVSCDISKEKPAEINSTLTCQA